MIKPLFALMHLKLSIMTHRYEEDLSQSLWLIVTIECRTEDVNYMDAEVQGNRRP